jgi:acetoacetyl-CoA synthetase
VPDAIVAVHAVPHTRTGKKLEVPVKRILEGSKADDVTKLDTLGDPSALDDFIEFARGREGAERG